MLKSGVGYSTFEPSHPCLLHSLRLRVSRLILLFLFITRVRSNDRLIMSQIRFQIKYIGIFLGPTKNNNTSNIVSLISIHLFIKILKFVIHNFIVSAITNCARTCTCGGCIKVYLSTLCAVVSSLLGIPVNSFGAPGFSSNNSYDEVVV